MDRKHAPFLVLRVHHAVCDGFHLAMAFPRMVTTSPTGGEVGYARTPHPEIRRARIRRIRGAALEFEAGLSG